ncbi:MAG: hypothetical protein AAF993_10610 [Pseudomonadota bacterium]
MTLCRQLLVILWSFLTMVSAALASVADAASESPVYLSFSAVDAEIVRGQPVSLSWAATGADRCIASGGWSGEQALAGSLLTKTLSESTTFALTCNNMSSTITRKVRVALKEPVAPLGDVPEDVAAELPTITFRAEQESIRYGESVRLFWATTATADCRATGDWRGPQPSGGELWVGPLHSAASFILSCSGPGGATTAQVDVTVMGQISLAWTLPQSNMPAAAGAHYRIHYGKRSGHYIGHVDVVAGLSAYRLVLPAGEYYVAMSALSANDWQSELSREVRLPACGATC